MRIEKEHWIFNKKIAHRGLHNELFPENTIKAFEMAVQKDYAIETDLQVCASGEVVVFHDWNLKRATKGADTRCISSITLDELRKIKLFGSEYSVMTLEEFLKIVDGKVPLLIEFKMKITEGVNVLEKSSKLFDNYAGKFAVQSFNPYCLKWYKENRPNVLRGQLSSFFDDASELSLIKKFVLKRMMFNKKTTPDFISYDVRNLPNKYVSRYKRNNRVPVIAWTVRSQSEYDRVNNFCDNIIFENFIPADNS